MNNNINKIEIPRNLLGELRLIEVLDFVDFPLLTVESSLVGTYYLNYFYGFEENIQQRLLIEISEERLKLVQCEELSVKAAFEKAERGIVYFANFDNKSKLEKLFFLPVEDFLTINPIPGDYEIDPPVHTNKMNLTKLSLLSQQRDKYILGFYLKSNELKTSLKYWAIKNFLMPLSEMILVNFGISLNKPSGKELMNQLGLGITSLEVSSLSGNIELNNISDLFNYNPFEMKLIKLFEMFNSTEKDMVLEVASEITDKKVLTKYIEILNTISKHNALLETGLAMPNDKVFSSIIDKDKALIVKKILNEAYPVIQDIEEIEGIFLELNLAIKNPSFSISAVNEDLIYHGKLSDELNEKIANKSIVFRGKEYLFTIQTTYHQETASAPEKTQRILVNFEELAS